MSPLVMGVLNVTPDSFSDGGRHDDTEAAIAHGRRIAAAGADLIDVGGESTRPGAAPVSEHEELRRVIPVIEALADEIEVSVDTVKPAVAVAAIAAGATIVNDVSAELEHVAGDHGVGWIAMHRQGQVATMQDAPTYEDVVRQVLDHLVERADTARTAGVERLWIDPGIGFGKTLRHNLELLAHLDAFVATGLPVAIGTSRKSSLGALLAASDARGAYRPDGLGPVFADVLADADPSSISTDDRLEGSLTTATWAFARGADLVRVHDVAPTVQALRVVTADLSDQEQDT